jgi:glutathione S-transferase
MSIASSIEKRSLTGEATGCRSFCEDRRAVKIKFYVIPASHPSKAVLEAARFKGLRFEEVTLLPGTQPVVATMLFGGRTIPAMKISGGPNGNEKVQTTAKIFRALESIRPEPPLYPADAAEREKVLAAEAWGLGEFQDLARRIAWLALTRDPQAMFSFVKPGELRVPNSALKPFVSPTLWIERKLNGVSKKRTRADLEQLPRSVEQIQAMIDAGTIGNAQPNAADFAVFSSIWLLRSFEDLRPMLDSSAVGRKAKELLGDAPGHVDAGAFPAAWLTNVNTAAAAGQNSSSSRTG